MNTIRKNLIILFGFLSISTFGQNPSMNDPLSYYGLGRVSNAETNAIHYSGNLSSTYKDVFNYNLSNPAALGYLTNYTNLDISVQSKYNTFDINGTSDTDFSGFLDYLALSMPLINQRNEFVKPDSQRIQLGLGFHLKNFSRSGYDISSLSLIDSTRTRFVGSGNQYKTGVDVGLKWRNMAYGLGADYVFGKLEDTRYISFANAAESNTTYYNENTNTRTVRAKLGGLYSLKIEDFIGKNKILKDSTLNDFQKNNKIEKLNPLDITFGARVTLPLVSTIKSGQDIYRRNFFTEQVYGIDTISVGLKESYPLNTPMEVGLGASFERKDKLLLGVDFAYINWSQTKIKNRPSSLNDHIKLSVGGVYTPNSFDVLNYLNRIRYRFGAYTTQDYVIVNNETVNNYGITFGLGFPAKLSRNTKPAFFNLGFDFGQNQSTSGYLMNNYVGINVGFVMTSDQWFIKRKID